MIFSRRTPPGSAGEKLRAHDTVERGIGQHTGHRGKLSFTKKWGTGLLVGQFHVGPVILDLISSKC